MTWQTGAKSNGILTCYPLHDASLLQQSAGLRAPSDKKKQRYAVVPCRFCNHEADYCARGGGGNADEPIILADYSAPDSHGRLLRRPFDRPIIAE